MHIDVAIIKGLTGTGGHVNIFVYNTRVSYLFHSLQVLFQFEVIENHSDEQTQYNL